MSELACFAFNTHAVRAISRDGEPWFVAGDVASVLGFRHVPHMVRMLDDDEADVHNVDSRSENGVIQSREVTIISESGLYACILKSRRKEAQAFRKWVTSEVLPSIRKTGVYGNAAPPPYPGIPAHRADVLVAADRTFRALMRSGRTAGLPLGRAIRRANEVALRETGIDMLAELDAPELLPDAAPLLDSADRFLAAWLAGETRYPCAPCATMDLLCAYRQWCGGQAERAVGDVAFLARAGKWPNLRKMTSHAYDTPDRTGKTRPHRIFLPDISVKPESWAQAEWLTVCLFSFRTVLAGNGGGV